MKILATSFSVAILTVSLNSFALSARADLTQPSQVGAQSSLLLAQADESKMIADNQQLLISNRALARKIAGHLGLTSTGDVPTTGTPLEQNQVLILQNQATFKAIADKVGAKVPALPPAEGATPAEKNHNLLLQNRQIVLAILDKLAIPPAAPAALTGTFVAKNHALLNANAATLAKIAAKLGVK